MRKFVPWIVGIVLIVGGGWFVMKDAFNLPGEVVADQGRDHWEREKLEKFTYNSNPPTSGPHDPDWIRPGVYDSPQDKYKLIHSLEHGYIEFHYNCKINSQQSTDNSYWGISVSAHEDEVSTSSASPTSVPTCETADQLKRFVEKLGLKRVIVNPNSEIDRRIVIVAWNRILKMDTLDEEMATKFAKAFHNKGPEQTME